MRNLFKKILTILKTHEEPIRYIFFGVLTVLVNTVLFVVGSKIVNEIVANTIAFFLSVQFAYFTNTKFVFRTSFTKQNFLQFWGMRIGTILIDNGGMFFLLLWGVPPLFAKIVVNAVVIVLNYLFSKFIIYRDKENHT